jgi:hypothetical protein
MSAVFYRSTCQRTLLNSILICSVLAFVPKVIRKAVLFAFGTVFSFAGPFWPPGKVVIIIIIIIIICGIKNTGDTINNWSEWNHYKIIRQIREHHTRKP